VGSLVHTLIEEYERGDLPARTLETLVEEAERRWQPEQFPSFAVSEAFRKLVTQSMLPNWFGEYAGTPAVASEKLFEFQFEGATIRGYIDRIGPVLSGGNRITDFKTGKGDYAGPPQENLQLGIYYLAVSECDDLAPYRPLRGVELAFLRGKRNDHSRVHKIPWQPNSDSAPKYHEAMRERLTGLIGRIRTLYEKEIYRPSTAADCHWCEFKMLCPLWPQGAPVFAEPRAAREEVRAP
jgi:hypothetical protein